MEFRSRVGGKPVQVVSGVSVTLDSRKVNFQGSLGTISVDFPDVFRVTHEENSLIVSPLKMSQKISCLWGTVRQSLQNAMQGVSQGFRKQLELVGVGYRVLQAGEDGAVLKVGFSHDVIYRSPYSGVRISSSSPTLIEIFGVVKKEVGQVAADIIAIRPSEPYKGKGIKYAGQKIALKAGKNK